jgi:hypothetical protein
MTSPSGGREGSTTHHSGVRRDLATHHPPSPHEGEVVKIMVTNPTDSITRKIGGRKKIVKISNGARVSFQKIKGKPQASWFNLSQPLINS